MDILRFKNLVQQTWTDLPNALLNKGQVVTSKIEKISKLEMTVMHMATSHVGLMISLAASCLDDNECYVNVGTWKGYSFFAGFVDNPKAYCIGNDNFSLFTGERSTSLVENDFLGRNFGDTKGDFYREFNRLKTINQRFIEKDWLDFFSDFKNITDKKIAFYFYDGDHSFDAQYKALKIVQPFLSHQCIILIDDTNMEQVSDANKKFLSENPDFALIYDLPTPCNRYPTWWNGLQILARE